mgnify:CR=1 FL=1
MSTFDLIVGIHSIAEAIICRPSAVRKIIATQDGGCLVYGTIYDWRTQNNQFNTFAIKLDGLGNTSWIKEEPYQQIPITIFPFDYNQHEISSFSKNQSQENVRLWQDLKEGFTYFELNKKLPVIQFFENGRCQIID